MALKREELPAKVQSFLESPDLTQKAFDIIEKYQVPDEQSGEVAYIIECENEQGQILDKNLLAKIPQRLQKLTGLDPAKAQQMAVDLVGARLLPIEDQVGGVSELLSQWGGKPGEHSVKQVSRTNVTADELVRGVVEEMGIKFEEPAMDKRLIFILTTMARGVRTDLDVIKALSRNKKVGGLEMEEGQAKEIVQKIKSHISGSKLEEDKPVSAEVKLPPKREVPPPPKFDATVISKQDEQEAAALVKKVTKVAQSISIEDGVKRVIEEVGGRFKDEKSKKRFEKIVDSRLREVRDAFTTRTALEDPVAKGGLNLKGKELVEILQSIEKAFDDSHRVIAEKAVKEKQKFEKKQVEKKQQAEADKAEALDRRYAKMTGRPAKQPPAAVQTEMSPASVPPKGTKPAVQDIAPARKLAGPVQELENMDLVGFRRLAQDPNEAILKIKDKIELLESESYAKRIAGVKGWQSSPVNKMYVDLTRQALVTGKPIEQVAAAKQKGGSDSLSKEEIQAIMKLNNQLRF